MMRAHSLSKLKARDAMTIYTTVGKEMLKHGKHFADFATPEDAAMIAAYANKMAEIHADYAGARQGVHEVCDRCGLDLRTATTECPTWHGLDIPCDRDKTPQQEQSK